jgi:hypothetical protein
VRAHHGTKFNLGTNNLVDRSGLNNKIAQETQGEVQREITDQPNAMAAEFSIKTTIARLGTYERPAVPQSSPICRTRHPHKQRARPTRVWPFCVQRKEQPTVQTHKQHVERRIEAMIAQWEDLSPKQLVRSNWVPSIECDHIDTGRPSHPVHQNQPAAQ